MKLQPTKNARERILGMGGPGSGKTHSWFQIAKATPEHVQFYVLDTDQTVERFLDSDEFSMLQDRVHYVEPMSWPEYVETLKEWVKNDITSEDWLVVDMISQAWDEVQEYFTEEIFGEDIGSYFMKIRKDMDEKKKTLGSGFDGWKDWTVINKLYRVFANTIKRSPGHVYIATPADKMDFDNEQAENLKLYGHVGYKPRGQKHTGHAAQTIIMFHRNNAGDFKMSTVKDRQRDDMKAENNRNFAIKYLKNVAGWEKVEAPKNSDDGDDDGSDDGSDGGEDGVEAKEE